MSETAYELYPEVKIVTEGYGGGYLVKWYDAASDEQRVYEVPRGEIETLVMRVVTRALFHGTLADRHPDAHHI